MINLNNIKSNSALTPDPVKASIPTADGSPSFQDMLDKAQLKASEKESPTKALKTIVSSLQKKGLLNVEQSSRILDDQDISSSSDLQTAKGNLVNGITFSEPDPTVEESSTSYDEPESFAESTTPSFSLDTSPAQFNSGEDYAVN